MLDDEADDEGIGEEIGCVAIGDGFCLGGLDAVGVEGFVFTFIFDISAN